MTAVEAVLRIIARLRAREDNADRTSALHPDEDVVLRSRVRVEAYRNAIIEASTILAEINEERDGRLRK